jgi:hemoglobin
MCRGLQSWLLVCAAVSLAAPAEPARAAEPAPAPAPLDRQIADTLRDVHNRGADLYNAGDEIGCYRVFQGLLWAVRPLLAHHANLQQEIDAGMAAAERLPAPKARAQALHELITRVRRSLLPGEKKIETRPEEKKPEKPPATLWQRLGGEDNVRKIVDDFVAAVATDPKVNFDRNGRHKLTIAQIVETKNKIVAFVSQANGGPLKYTGKSMKEAHQGMGITDTEFDAAAVHLRKALEKNGVKPADVRAVMEAVEGTRKDIVENKPAEKKPEEKKPARKKPEDKGKEGK